MQMKPNGLVRVERHKYMRDNGERVVTDVAARITAKRISVVGGGKTLDVFDRITGRCTHPFNPYIKHRCAIAYKLGDADWVRIGRRPKPPQTLYIGVVDEAGKHVCFLSDGERRITLEEAKQELDTPEMARLHIAQTVVETDLQLRHS